MKRLAIAISILVVDWAFASPMLLDQCVRHGDSISIRFISNHSKRRISISAKGFSLGGNVKGSGSLASIKELRLEPNLLVRFDSSQVEFGALNAPCRASMAEVAKLHGINVTL